MNLMPGETFRDPFSRTLVLLIERHPSDRDGTAGWIVRTESGDPDWFPERTLLSHFRPEAAPSPTKTGGDDS